MPPVEKDPLLAGGIIQVYAERPGNFYVVFPAEVKGKPTEKEEKFFADKQDEIRTAYGDQSVIKSTQPLRIQLADNAKEQVFEYVIKHLKNHDLLNSDGYNQQRTGRFHGDMSYQIIALEDGNYEVRGTSHFSAGLSAPAETATLKLTAMQVAMMANTFRVEEDARLKVRAAMEAESKPAAAPQPARREPQVIPEHVQYHLDILNQSARSEKTKWSAVTPPDGNIHLSDIISPPLSPEDAKRLADELSIWGNAKSDRGIRLEIKDTAEGYKQILITNHSMKNLTIYTPPTETAMDEKKTKFEILSQKIQEASLRLSQPTAAPASAQVDRALQVSPRQNFDPPSSATASAPTTKQSATAPLSTPVPQMKIAILEEVLTANIQKSYDNKRSVSLAQLKGSPGNWLFNIAKKAKDNSIGQFQEAPRNEQIKQLQAALAEINKEDWKKDPQATASKAWQELNKIVEKIDKEPTSVKSALKEICQEKMRELEKHFGVGPATPPKQHIHKT